MALLAVYGAYVADGCGPTFEVDGHVVEINTKERPRDSEAGRVHYQVRIVVIRTPVGRVESSSRHLHVGDEVRTRVSRGLFSNALYLKSVQRK